MKLNLIIFLFLFCILTVVLLNYNIFAQTSFKENVTVGLQAGYSVITGYYSDSLNNGFCAGFFSFVPFNDLFMLNGMLVYNRFSLTNSSNSSIQSFGITIAPSLYYALPYTFTMYAGAGISLQYYTLSAMKTDASDSTTKTNFLLNAGIAKSFYERTLIVAECTYYITQLSHKYFQTIVFSLKAGYQFALHNPEYYISRETEKNAVREQTVQKLFNAAMDYVQKKDHIHALESFKQVLSLKPDHKESLQYVAAISQAKEQYDTAVILIKQDKYFDALPLLSASSRYIAQAHADYKNLQNKLRPQISTLQQKAIEAFDNKDYDACISIMNTVLLIDPDNTVAKGYIVRSKRIKETIQKLQ
ncbi:MAG: outer membrane beta-barrel protein [Spirochaetota bacterium]